MVIKKFERAEYLLLLQDRRGLDHPLEFVLVISGFHIKNY
jgi:hypothetical protein